MICHREMDALFQLDDDSFSLLDGFMQWCLTEIGFRRVFDQLLEFYPAVNYAFGAENTF